MEQTNEETQKEYTNGEVTVVWQPHKCIHSTICFKGLPRVFNPKARPWVNTEGATTEKIVEQIRQCPSGALSFYYNDAEKQNESPQEVLETKVEVLPNGPLLVYGTLTISDKDGKVIKRNKTTAFCRCGFSNNKPFCDGSHIAANFEG
ncbi:MAG: (4Fe-4S)-binding protein [Microscillaceae bacterium]|jgi:uncharacterized Fe-S cluster protein YjdI|nr:(4Fe-4S)-binding protein [Microscillaceae bacterium]